MTSILFSKLVVFEGLEGTVDLNKVIMCLHAMAYGEYHETRACQAKTTLILKEAVMHRNKCDDGIHWDRLDSCRDGWQERAS